MKSIDIDWTRVFHAFGYSVFLFAPVSSECLNSPSAVHSKSAYKNQIKSKENTQLLKTKHCWDIDSKHDDDANQVRSKKRPGRNG